MTFWLFFDKLLSKLKSFMKRIYYIEIARNTTDQALRGLFADQYIQEMS